MEGDIIIIKKADLIEALEKNSRKILDQMALFAQKKNSMSDEGLDAKVKRLNTREIKEMLGIGDTTFERIQHNLPLHKTKTGRLFAYEHDLIIHLFREHPPYFDINLFKKYISQSKRDRFIGK
jgi:hypothetical protein